MYRDQHSSLRPMAPVMKDLHIVERISKTNAQPREPDQGCRYSNPSCLKQALQMHPDLQEREARVCMRARTAGS